MSMLTLGLVIDMERYKSVNLRYSVTKMLKRHKQCCEKCLISPKIVTKKTKVCQDSRKKHSHVSSGRPKYYIGRGYQVQRCKNVKRSLLFTSRNLIEVLSIYRCSPKSSPHCNLKFWKLKYSMKYNSIIVQYNH